jgi:hypothetical protein
VPGRTRGGDLAWSAPTNGLVPSPAQSRALAAAAGHSIATQTSIIADMSTQFAELERRTGMKDLLPDKVSTKKPVRPEPMVNERPQDTERLIDAKAAAPPDPG